MLCVLYDTRERAIIYRPQIGDRQGDSPAAQRYVLAQDPVLRRWQSRMTDALEREMLMLCGPFSSSMGVSREHIIC